MLTRRLGRTGLTPSILGFGCARIASLATAWPPAEVEAALREAFAAGVNFFDTADVYGQGDSERLLGRLFQRDRERVIFCTKVGLTVGPLQTWVRLVKPLANTMLRRWRAGRTASTAARHRSERQCFDPAYLRRRIEGSLGRLRTDRIDLLLLHNPPPALPNRAAVLELLRTLKREGKLRHFGVSCGTIEHAPTWLDEPDVACLQLPLQRTRLDSATAALRRAAAHDVGVIAREAFGGGALLRDCDPTAVLAPLLARAEIGTILLGMTCRSHLRANLAAFGAAAV